MQTHAQLRKQQNRGQEPLPATLAYQPTRQGILAEIEKLRKSYFRVRNELERHRRVTLPAYESWYRENFGELEKCVRRLASELAEKKRLVDRMNALYTWRGFTRQKAFQQASSDFRVLAEKNEREERKRAERAREEAILNARLQEVRRERLKEMEKALAVEESTPTADGDLKSYYRKLARALHPDRLQRECPVLQALWLETQEAYQSRDVEKLKLIWGECLLEANPEVDDLQAFDIRVVHTRLRAKFHEAQREKMRIAQSDPAWGFEKRDLAALAAKLLKELTEQKQDLEGGILVLDREIRAFTREHPVSAGADDSHFDYSASY